MNNKKTVIRPTARAFRDIEQLTVNDRGLRDEEAQALITQASSPELRDLLGFAIESTLRLHEILALRFEHVDLEDMSLIIAYDARRERPERTAYLPSGAISVLRRVTKSNGRFFDLDESDVAAGIAETGVKARSSYERQCVAQAIEPIEARFSCITFRNFRYEAMSRWLERLGPYTALGMSGYDPISFCEEYDPLLPPWIKTIIEGEIAKQNGISGPNRNPPL